jgi:hypothetical protein
VALTVEPDTRHRHPSADAVCAALMDLQPTDDAVRLDDLASEIELAWRTWQQASAFRYASVGQRLPALIRRAQAVLVRAERLERRGAFRSATVLYQLVRTWTKRVGEHELSFIAADRAVAHAVGADEPALAGAAAWNLGMILSAQGRTEQASEVVSKAVNRLRWHLDQPGPECLAVFGGLHLLGASEAARQDADDEVERLLEVADRVADRTGETNHFRMAFGPTNVALHRLSVAVERGRTGQALELAETVTVAQAPSVERRLTFHLDTARCYTRAGNDVAAVFMLQHVGRESPEELRYNPVAQKTLGRLRARAKPAIRHDLEPLLDAAGLPS